MSWVRRGEIVVAVTAISAFLMLIPYYFRVPVLGEMSSQLQNWTTVILAFAMGYGAVSLLLSHSRKILERKEGAHNSLALLIAMFAMIASGVAPPFFSHPVNVWLYSYVLTRIHQAIYALLAPFIASAAYRALRARSTESALMLVAGVLVMLANAPVGGYMWAGFPAIGTWLYSVPNVGAQRGIIIGVAIGTIALGIRIIAGFERTLMGREGI